ncbi:oxidoreductase [Kitasatospora sp. NPDC085895]|uniref:oxidoreductase n=1 Tax=Kitasatospora sp. NPDC085895 TaxID=3155057 RepID=UPI00344CE656
MPAYEELGEAERRLWEAFPRGEELDLRGAADTAVRAEVVAALLLGGGPTAVRGRVGGLRLVGATVTGQLDLTGAAVELPVQLRDCTFEQRVLLRGATVRSTSFLDCRLPGLDGWLLRVDGNLFFEDSVIEGRLTLTRAHITGELRLSGVRLTASELLEPAGPGERPAPAWSLWAGGLVMEGGCFARKGFRSRGGLRLVGANFGGGLFMEGAGIDNPGGEAFSGDDLTASTMVLTDGFEVHGALRLPGATVRNRLSLDGARLHGDGTTALDATRLTAGDLHLTPAAVPGGTVDLSAAQVAVLHDNAPARSADTRLDGLVYTSLQGATGLDDRLAWLGRTPGYTPQPYEQLAAWYRRIGHDDDARRVLLAKQRRRRRTLGPLGRVWGRLLDATVGYGYRPWQAAVWLAALIAAGTAAFSHGSPTAVQAGQGAPFNPLIYTMDLLIPIGGFGQRTAWYWTGLHQWLGYALIAAGWLLTTATLAGVTRSLNRS